MIRETNYDEVFEAQEHFRIIMDAMARPGSIHKLDGGIEELEGVNKATCLVAFTLLDSNVTFYQRFSETFDEYLILNTSSSPAQAEQADFLFLNGNEEMDQVIEQAKEGDPEYPEKGAFLIIQVAKISYERFNNSHEVILNGPGVKAEQPIYLEGIEKSILEIIKEKNVEYPLGVDTLLTDPRGNTVGIPRSNQFTF
ncbi:MAG: phosphonate C-P lyase system protein PhnH [Bacteroidota bacterium]